MKLSARNILSGTVVEVTRGAVIAKVRVDVGDGNVITSTITLDSADDLGLEPGKHVHAIIKASEVILATDD